MHAVVLLPFAMAQPEDFTLERPISGPETVYLPEMTWMEVRDAMAAGKRTVLVPTGGIEQNGPFLALDKHDRIAREVAERTAVQLGDALVGPVVSFVPEGNLQPRTGHMEYPGTVGVRTATFEAILADLVVGYRSHGFEHVVFVGDSGGNQESQADVAAAWDGWGVRVHHIEAFYDPDGANAFVEERGLTWTADAFHDDPGFTLQLLAVDPAAARLDERRDAGVLTTDGFSLEPVEDRVALGSALMDWRATRSATAIREARDTPPWSWVDGARAVFSSPVTSVVAPSARIFWVYLMTSFFMAFFAEAIRQGRDWSIPTVLAALFPREIWLSRDAFADLLYTLLGGAFLFGWLSVSWPFLTGVVRSGTEWVLGFTGVETLGLPSSGLLVGLTTLVFLLAGDFATWLGHWASHHVPILWTFHKVHHAARHMTPLTVFRQHPVDLVVSAAFASVVVGVVLGVLTWLSPDELQTMQIAGLNIGIFAFYLLGYNLRHSHVWVSFGPLERVFVSPAMHQIHHSEDPRHHDRNLGLMFSIWDQLFGTAYIPTEREELSFGIGEESEEFRTVFDFWVLPFRQLFRRDGSTGRR